MQRFYTMPSKKNCFNSSIKMYLIYIFLYRVIPVQRNFSVLNSKRMKKFIDYVELKMETRAMLYQSPQMNKKIKREICTKEIFIYSKNFPPYFSVKKWIINNFFNHLIIFHLFISEKTLEARKDFFQIFLIDIQIIFSLN